MNKGKAQATKFDGRSFVINRLEYTLGERVIVFFSMNVMPTLTRLLFFHRLNTILWRLLGCQIGKGSIIRMGTQINAPFRVKIGSNCLVHGHLKSRGGITIGNGVEFVEDVFVSTQSHKMESPFFESVYSEVKIEDYAWLGPRCIVLPGVNISRGSAIAAAAVVSKSTEAWCVYAGIPARIIKRRAPLQVEPLQ